MLKRALLTLTLLAASTGMAHAAGMTLISPDVTPNAKMADEQVANGFGCSGGNISPALSWAGAPKGTKSFAVTMYDPDAPTGSGFWHWTVFNIPATVTTLPKGAGAAKSTTLPAGAIQSRGDAGTVGYFGMCPPKGDKPHHYKITVFAVDVEKLDADGTATPAVIGFNLHFHTLGKASVTGLYGR